MRRSRTSHWARHIIAFIPPKKPDNLSVSDVFLDVLSRIARQVARRPLLHRHCSQNNILMSRSGRKSELTRISPNFDCRTSWNLWIRAQTVGCPSKYWGNNLYLKRSWSNVEEAKHASVASAFNRVKATRLGLYCLQTYTKRVLVSCREWISSCLRSKFHGFHGVALKQQTEPGSLTHKTKEQTSKYGPQIFRNPKQQSVLWIRAFFIVNWVKIIVTSTVT